MADLAYGHLMSAAREEGGMVYWGRSDITTNRSIYIGRSVSAKAVPDTPIYRPCRNITTFAQHLDILCPKGIQR